jgi:hypothetical protein
VHVRLWHFSDMARCLTRVRFAHQGGLSANGISLESIGIRPIACVLARSVHVRPRFAQIPAWPFVPSRIQPAAADRARPLHVDGPPLPGLPNADQVGNNTNGNVNFFLEREADLDKVLQIFIRINSGGTKLSYPDLLLSIATASWKGTDAGKPMLWSTDRVRLPNTFTKVIIAHYPTIEQLRVAPEFEVERVLLRGRRILRRRHAPDAHARHYSCVLLEAGG